MLAYEPAPSGGAGMSTDWDALLKAAATRANAVGFARQYGIEIAYIERGPDDHTDSF